MGTTPAFALLTLRMLLKLRDVEAHASLGLSGYSGWRLPARSLWPDCVDTLPAPRHRRTVGWLVAPRSSVSGLAFGPGTLRKTRRGDDANGDHPQSDKPEFARAVLRKTNHGKGSDNDVDDHGDHDEVDETTRVPKLKKSKGWVVAVRVLE
jgi:hypothetical protein